MTRGLLACSVCGGSGEVRPTLALTFAAKTADNIRESHRQELSLDTPSLHRAYSAS